MTLNTQELRITSPVVRSHPKGGYKTVKNETTEQLRREVNALQGLRTKGTIRPAKDFRSDRARVEITRVRKETGLCDERIRTGEPVSNTWREGIELGLTVALAIIVTMTAMNWLM